MSRLSGWFRGSSPRTSVTPSPAGSEVALQAVEIANMEDAMSSIAKIMNDDFQGAEEGLQKTDSPFHSLGHGTTTFMRSVMGFEKDIMAEATRRLNQTESMADSASKRAKKEASGSRGSGRSQIYPPGSEYVLVQAEAQLMGAVVAVLHESVLDAVRGFTKLRSAYAALDGLMKIEEAYLKQKGVSPGDVRNGLADADVSETFAAEDNKRDEDKDLEFVEAPEELTSSTPPVQYQGHLSKDADEAEKKMAGLEIDPDEKTLESLEEHTSLNSSKRVFSNGPDSTLFTDPMDIFIHSGTNMCFGTLNMLISMIPPAFSMLLNLVGFSGDREKGIKMLWQSTRFENFNGAVAAYCLLAYYNGLLGFADILPSDEDAEKGAITGYPRRRCAALLAKMRTRYPDSGLWRLEEARGLSNSRDLPGAIAILKQNKKSEMRQVTALNSFELSLDVMFVGDYDTMRDSFLHCIELNDWSHAMYYFLAGAAEIELYRNAVHAEKRDEAVIEAHKKKAVELIRRAPSLVGKKKFLSRPMPFEQFVQRKIDKWDARAKELKIDFIDAVGVSPVQEMVYLWNGIKKMGPQELENAATKLDWTRLTAPKETIAKIRAEKDEAAIADVCRAAVYRALGRIGEARELCTGIIGMDKLAFKGPNKDDYVQAAAHYEMAALAWVEVRRPELRRTQTSTSSKSQPNGTTANDDQTEITSWQRKKTNECQGWLQKVSGWGSFLLDARIGIKVSTGMSTLKWFRRDKGWPET